MTDAAIAELAPVIGVRDACNAVGVAQAGWYRRHRHAPAPQRGNARRRSHTATGSSRAR